MTSIKIFWKKLDKYFYKNLKVETKLLKLSDSKVRTSHNKKSYTCLNCFAFLLPQFGSLQFMGESIPQNEYCLNVENSSGEPALYFCPITHEAASVTMKIGRYIFFKYELFVKFVINSIQLCKIIQ